MCVALRLSVCLSVCVRARTRVSVYACAPVRACKLLRVPGADKGPALACRTNGDDCVSRERIKAKCD